MNFDGYVKTITTASGLTEEQAKTCVYYTVCTYHLADLMKLPTFSFQGPAGTGKTSAMEQLRRIVKEPKPIQGRTYATVRDELTDATTALIDEADSLDRLEELLTSRHSKENGTFTVNHSNSQGGYQPKKHNIFGATIVCRRVPFADVAFRSRAIVIPTRHKRGKYTLNGVEGFGSKAMMTELKIQETSDRVEDTWEPLLAVARSLKDDEWLEYAEKEIEKQTMLMRQSQGIEPQEALVYTLKAFSRPGAVKVRISDIKQALKENFDVTLKVGQVMDICSQQGFRVVKPQGYPQVEVVRERIEELVEQFE